MLPIKDYSNGYAVEEIEGLSPVAATLSTSSLAQVDGEQPQNAQRPARNITMKVGLKPDYVSNTVDSLRMNAYSYFMTKALVTLNFYFDDVFTYTCQGQVETCDNDRFSADPELDISIMCYDPDFYAASSIEIDTSTNPSTNLTEIDYPGSSECGIIFVLGVNASVSGFQIFNTRPDGTVQVMGITPITPFFNTNQVGIDTIPGERSITLNGNNDILWMLDDDSDWIMLGPNGSNFFRGYAGGLSVPYRLIYTPKFGGI